MSSRFSVRDSRSIHVSVGLVALVYAVTAHVGLLLSLENSGATPVWPPSGIALAALLICGLRAWPGIFIGAFLSNAWNVLGHGTLGPLGAGGVAAAIAAGNTLEAVLGWLLLRRVTSETGALSRGQDMVWLAVIAPIMCLVAALGGATSRCVAGFAGWDLFRTILFTWWIGDVVGVLVFTPLLVAWSRGRGRGWSGWRVVEGAFLASLILFVSLYRTPIAAAGVLASLRTFALFPAMLWVAFRFGPRFTTSLVFLVSVAVLFETLRDWNLVAASERNLALILRQGFVAALAITASATALAVRELRLAQAQLRRANEHLELRVLERTAELAASVDELESQVDERLRIEEALRRSEANLLAAQRIARVGYWEYSVPDGRFRASEELRRFYGFEEADESLDQARLLARIHPEDLALIEQHREELIQSSGPDQPAEVDFRVLEPNGGVLYLHSLTQIERDGSGRPLRLFGTTQDITVRRQVEQARARLEVELRHAQKMESLGQLAGGVAHDFNNLLLVILGHVDMYQQGVFESELDRQEAVAQIRFAAERAADLTRQLLAFSSRQPLAPVSLDLNERVDGLTRMLQRLIPADIELELVADQGLPPIHADPGQLEQVLVNLCLNARDAMPDGGKLRLETFLAQFEEPLDATRTWGRPGSFACLRVSDSGMGMDAAVKDRIFDPFFTTKAPGKGTGLGLATAYGIVEQHAGFLRVESAPGKGTSVEVYLPVAEQPVRVVTRRPSMAVHKRGSEMILLAEDERMVRELVEEVLRGAGYQVLAAADGAEAVEVFEQHKADIDLVLLDIIMPRMNGPRAFEQIVTMRPDVRFLFTSGYTNVSLPDGGQLDQDVEVLRKPYHPETLLLRLREILDTPLPRQDAAAGG